MLPRFIVPRRRRGAPLTARQRQAAPVPGQLTLDDWADELNSNGMRTAAASPARRTSHRVGGSRSHPRCAAYAPANGSPESDATVQDETGRDAAEPAPIDGVVQHHPETTELLSMPDALLTRTHLRELGLERRAVDAVFRAIPVVDLPGYSRPMVRVEDYLELIGQHTYRDDRVRPCRA